MKIIIRTISEPENKTPNHYLFPDETWNQISTIEGGGRISLGKNHKLITINSLKDHVEKENWKQPHLS